MKIGIGIKIAVLTVFCLCIDSVKASGALDRHEDEPPRHHVQPQATPSGRNAGIGDSSRCSSDAEGFFGDKSANGVSLKYYYELEYDTRIVPGISNRILKTIQNKIADYLLPVLFQRACVDTRRKLTSGVESGIRRRLEAVGISALPNDMIVKGGKFCMDE